MEYLCPLPLFSLKRDILHSLLFSDLLMVYFITPFSNSSLYGTHIQSLQLTEMAFNEKKETSPASKN
jgi:hypothetical protein